MTDAQSAAIVAAIVAGSGTIGALVRASAAIVRDAMAASTAAIKDNTAAFARVAELLGRVDVRTETVHARVQEVADEVSGVHTAATSEVVIERRQERIPTPPKGTYHIGRSKTHG